MDGYPIQTNFTAGEVSPLLRGRVDITKYFNGAAKLENFLVKPQGGIVRRSGTRFVYEVKDSTKLTILVNFQVSTSIAYILEFGHNYIRIFKNGAVVTSSGSPVEVTTTYTESELRDLSFAQSADILFIAHNNHPPAKLSRTSDTAWTLADIVFEDGPYLDPSTSQASISIYDILNWGHLFSTASDFAVGDLSKYVEFPYKDGLAIGQIYSVNPEDPFNDGFISATEVIIQPFDNIVDLSKLDTRAKLVYVAGSGNGTVSFAGVLAAARTFVLPVGCTISPLTSPSVLNEAVVVPAGNTINLPSGATYTGPGGGGWPDRIRANIAVFNSESENSFIKVQGTWYLTGEHFQQVETYNATPGGDTDVDVIAVAGAPPMVPTTGTLSFTGHRITARIRISQALLTNPDHIGRLVRLDFSGFQVWGKITAYIGASTHYQDWSIELGRALPLDKLNPVSYFNDASTLSFRLGAWYKNNYPGVVFFHEERLCFASTPAQPLTVWGSKSADYFNNAPTDEESKVTDDSAITYTISSSEMNAIRWAVSSSVILLGTNGSEWQTKANTINEPITPGNISVVEQTSFGSARYVKPIRIGSAVLFVQRSGTKLRELSYDFQQDSYVARDLTIISEHILRDYNGILQSAYQKEPNSIYWAVTTDGALLGLTYEKDQDVYAWHRHLLGGYSATGFSIFAGINLVCGTVYRNGTFSSRAFYSSGTVQSDFTGTGIALYWSGTQWYLAYILNSVFTNYFYSDDQVITPDLITIWLRNSVNNGKLPTLTAVTVPAVVESVATTPSIDGKSDTVYLVVRRVINGSTKRYIEYIEKDFHAVQTKREMFFVDCGLSYEGAAVSSVSGLSHLNGETVQIVADGSMRTSAVVSAGAVAISGVAASRVHVGLQYKSILQTLPIESGSQAGTAQGKMKRVQRIIGRFLDSIGFKHGPTEVNLRQESFRRLNDPMDQSPNLFSGDRDFDLSQDYSLDGIYVIQQDQPFPLTILCLMPQLQTYT